jgi:50S ribosomal protein L16 3-hydroxylase
MLLSRPDPLLGGLTPRQFVARHWQKRPLLVRRALAGFAGLLSPAQLMQLATHDDAQARVVIHAGRSFELRHGPFTRAFFRSLKGYRWTLLVQEVNQHLPQARALLDRFAFIPYARLDDLMVSYATPGGGMGPHFDSYDVFLLQGPGRRRWRISRQADLSLAPGAPLRILRRFRPEQKWVLGPGDMLYLPPSCAHDGVALEECMTYSIGFRAPSWQELTEQFLVHLQDTTAREGLYADPDLRPQARPARIASQMIARVDAALARIRWNKRDVIRFLGRYLTEPKPHVFFSPPQQPLPLAAFGRRIAAVGVTLDLRTQMLYSGSCFFINGEMLQADASTAPALRQLADYRRLDSTRRLQRELVQRLHAWYASGYLEIGPASPQERQ